MALTSDQAPTPRHTNFGEQLKHVVLTYTTQRLLRWVTGLFCLFFLPMLLMAAFAQKNGGDDSRTMAFLVGMPMMWSLIFLVGQAKSQFAHARARVMPNFLPAHLSGARWQFC